MQQSNTALSRRVTLSYEDALERAKEALRAGGFGVLTEIDVKETLRNKLQVDFRKYDIIGACNPPLAHRALQVETQVGLLLPCNVVVYEDDGDTVVAASDPEAAMSLADNPALAEVAKEAKERLTRALERL